MTVILDFFHIYYVEIRLYFLNNHDYPNIGRKINKTNWRVNKIKLINTHYYIPNESTKVFENIEEWDLLLLI